MPHIHTQPGEHDQTISIYIIRLDTDEPTALLHMHKKLHRLMPIGGHVELNENPWQTAARELTEESGYQIDDLELLQPPDRITSLSKTTLLPYPIVMNDHEYADLNHFHSDTSYLFVAHGEPKMSVGEGESTDLRWVTERQLDAINDPEIIKFTKEVYQYVFQVCLERWDRVEPGDFEL